MMIGLVRVFPLAIYAQSQDELYQQVREDLDDMFKDLDKSRVPTAFLLDYAVDLVDLIPYSGDELVDENYVDIDVYHDALYTIRSASLGEMPFGDVAEIIRNFQSLPNLSISMAAFKYNCIRSNAIDDNLINYNESSGRVSDRFINNRWVDPYVENAFFCFVPNKTIVQSLTTSFSFPAAYTFTNLVISDVFFDPGDGNGFRPISNTSPIQVTYSSSGEKELIIQIYTEDGDYVCEAHSKIIVCQDEIYDIPTKGTPEPDIFTTNYDNQEINAQVSYHYIPGNTSITKPFIVAEGFDPWIFQYMDKNISDEDIPDEDVHIGYNSDTTFYSYWKSSALKYEYDLVYIDWDNSLVDIRANAQLLVQIIENINQQKAAAGSSEKNVIMGQSMGGLIARYALRSMELELKSHDTATFISHDSPHWGANVPLGLLYFVRQLISLKHGFAIPIAIYDLCAEGSLTRVEQRFYSLLNAQSVKQMLVNYVGDYGIDNSVHESWQQTLDTYGFPTMTENISIINGRQYDKTSFLGGGQHFLYLNGSVKSSVSADLLLFIIGRLSRRIAPYDWLGPLTDATLWLGSTKLNIHAEINPLSAINIGGVLSKLNVNYVKKFLWIIPKTYRIHSSSYYVPADVKYYDDYSGSFYSLDKFFNIEHAIDTIYSDSNLFGSYSLTHKMANKIMFIPTASALAVNSINTPSSEQYMRDYYNNCPIPETETPFSAYMFASNDLFNDNKQEHIYIDNNVLNWIKSQICSKIEGPDLVTASADFSLYGYNESFQWKCSDTSKAIINNEGVLTAIDNGCVTIMAESYENGKLFRKTKKVMLGFPDLAISYRFTPGEGHTFDAVVVDSNDSQKLSELVQSGAFRYEWSILCGEEGLITTVGSSSSISHMPKEDETITICLRLVDNCGNKGEIYSRTIDLQNPFSINYKFVEVNLAGRVKFVKENGYEIGMPLEDLIVSFRNIAYNSDDNVFSLILKYIKGDVCYLSYPNNSVTTYLAGTRLTLQDKWRFTFFDTSLFTDALQDVISRAGGVSIANGEIIDFHIAICNSDKQIMQRIPFAIIYKSI